MCIGTYVLLNNLYVELLNNICNLCNYNVTILVTCATKHIYEVIKNTKTSFKSTYWKDEIGHNRNLVERKTKIHPNFSLATNIIPVGHRQFQTVPLTQSLAATGCHELHVQYSSARKSPTSLPWTVPQVFEYEQSDNISLNCKPFARPGPIILLIHHIFWQH
jgi:hypothetical protein